MTAPFSIKPATRILGRGIVFFQKVSSTNAVALRLASRGEPEGTLVLALEQTEGYGRMRRAWHSPPGGLWFSLILRPRITAERLVGLTLLSSMALVRALRKLLQIPVVLHWPNDIYLRGRKMGGILLEGRRTSSGPDYFVLGVGLNVNQKITDFPQDLRSTATSLLEELGRAVELPFLLEGILPVLEEGYLDFQERGLQPYLSELKSLCITIGRNVKVIQGTEEWEGIAQDLTGKGTLLIRDTAGKIRELLSVDRILLVE